MCVCARAYIHTYIYIGKSGESGGADRGPRFWGKSNSGHEGR